MTNVTSANGVHFEVVWHDDDVVSVRVSASNGAFSGVADAYVGSDGLVLVAENLNGFPVSPSDRREVTVGAFGEGSAGGGVTLRFACTDGSGHARVEVILEGDQGSGGDHPETVHLFIPIEAAAVDRFVLGVRRLATTAKGVASLDAAV